MTPSHTTIKTNMRPTLSTTPDTRLQGRLLVAARIIWATLVLLILASFGSMLPAYFSQLQTVCTDSQCAARTLRRIFRGSPYRQQLRICGPVALRKSAPHCARGSCTFGPAEIFSAQKSADRHSICHAEYRREFHRRFRFSFANRVNDPIILEFVEKFRCSHVHSPARSRASAAKTAASASEAIAAARRRFATTAAAAPAEQETEPEEENLSPVNRPMCTSLRVSEAAACRSMKTKEQAERN